MTATTNNPAGQEMTITRAEYDDLLRRISRLERGGVSDQTYLSVDDVCRMTGMKRERIYRLTCEQRIPYYKVRGGRRIHFKRAEIEEWLTENHIRTKADIDDAATTYVAINK